MKEGKENEWMNQFKSDLKKLEDAYETKIPQKYELMNALTDFKRQRKRAWKRELAAFIFTALTILATYFVIAFKMPAVFLWVQVLTLITVPFIYSAEKKRRRGISEVLDDGF